MIDPEVTALSSLFNPPRSGWCFRRAFDSLPPTTLSHLFRGLKMYCCSKVSKYSKLDLWLSSLSWKKLRIPLYPQKHFIFSILGHSWFVASSLRVPHGNRYLRILSSESYNGICVLADFSMCINKYQHSLVVFLADCLLHHIMKRSLSSVVNLLDPVSLIN